MDPTDRMGRTDRGVIQVKAQKVVKARKERAKNTLALAPAMDPLMVGSFGKLSSTNGILFLVHCYSVLPPLQQLVRKSSICCQKLFLAPIFFGIENIGER